MRRQGGALKRIIFGLVSALTIALPAQAKEVNMAGYLGNTLVVYIPDSIERHTWYDLGGLDEGGYSFGSAVHFDAAIGANGTITLQTLEEKWRQDKRDFPRVVPIDAQGREGVALQLRNHFPGDHWRELTPDGPNVDKREQYTIVPAHQ